MDPRQQIREALEWMHGGELIEIRALHVPQGGRRVNASGFFHDLDLAVEAAMKLDEEKAEGVYTLLNVPHPGLYARSPDQMTYGADKSTSDNDIITRKWLLIDVDVRRPTGISATDEQLAYALGVRDEIVTELLDYYPADEVRAACSGNGGHILARWKDDSELLLERIGQVYSDDYVSIDQSVTNPARLTRLYGTMTRKGYSVGAWKHRRSYLEPPIAQAAEDIL